MAFRQRRVSGGVDFYTKYGVDFPNAPTVRRTESRHSLYGELQSAVFIASSMLALSACSDNINEETGSGTHLTEPESALDAGASGDASSDGADSSSSDVTLDPPDTPTINDAGSPIGNDAGVVSGGGSTDDLPRAHLPLGIETVSFADGECPDGSWCWVTPVPIGEQFSAIGGTPDGQTVFAVGPDGACVQYDVATATWTIHRSSSREELLDVEVVSATDVWVAGAGGLDHYDGAKWERQLIGYTPSIVRGVGGELWAVSLNRLYTFRDGDWHLVVPSIDGLPVFTDNGGVLQVVAGDDTNEFWGLVFADVSRPYFELEVVHFVDGEYNKLEGKYAESYWPDLVRYQGALYFVDGTRWFDITQGWVEVGAPPDNFVTIGDDTLEIVGTTLSSAELDATPTREVPSTTALWGASAEQLWLALSGGGLMRVNYLTGESTNPAVTPDIPWHTTSGIEWAASGTDAWRGPELEHFDGAAWTKVVTDAGTPYVERINGSGPNDVWFVGALGTGFWHWDGNLVTSVTPSSADVVVTRVHAFDAETTWVAERRDTSAVIVRFDGDAWTDVQAWPFEPSQVNTVVDIAGPDPSNAYVALKDRVEHFDGNQWQTLFQAPDDEVFTAMAVQGERVWVLGEDFVYTLDSNGDWLPAWYGFQTMSWLGFAEGAVWMMGGWLSSGVLRLHE